MHYISGQPNAKPIVVTSKNPDAVVAGLIPGGKYEATVIAVSASGTQTPASNMIAFTLPITGAPVLTAADATGPTAGHLEATTPGTGGPWTSYTFTAVPRHGGDPIVVTCPTANCDIQGLLPATIYDVTVTAKDGSGKASLASNSLPLVTPPAG